MYVLNYYKTKVYVYLNLDKTSTNNLASNVCLELLQVYIYLNLDKTSTNNIASNVCLEFLNSDFHIFVKLEISDKIMILITNIISIPHIDKILAKILTYYVNHSIH